MTEESYLINGDFTLNYICVSALLVPMDMY